MNLYIITEGQISAPTHSAKVGQQYLNTLQENVNKCICILFSVNSGNERHQPKLYYLEKQCPFN